MMDASEIVPLEHGSLLLSLSDPDPLFTILSFMDACSIARVLRTCRSMRGSVRPLLPMLMESRCRVPGTSLCASRAPGFVPPAM